MIDQDVQSAPVIQCGDRELSLHRPRVMGILNMTPDSFSDGGQFNDLDRALYQVEAMLDAGADIVDIGGESTRPGAAAVSEQTEIDRIMPVLTAVRDRFDTIVSVDTSKAEVMRTAAAAGAGLLNDVRALREQGALQAAAASGLPVCLMHMQGEPRTMQENPHFDNVVADVAGFLQQRIEACRAAGIAHHQLLIDPGFGFGKTLQHNIALLHALPTLCAIAPVLIGVSRKRMIAALLGNDATDRVLGSVTAAVLCVQRGARIVRVHDVAQTVQALSIQQGLECDFDSTQE